MRLRSILSLAALSGFAVACSGSEGPNIKETSSDLTRNTAPSIAPAEVSQVAKDNADFAFALYHEATKSSAAADNTFFSPYSISIALAMTYAGARGQTAQEMASAMHFTVPSEKLHAAFDSIDLQLATRGKDADAKDGKAFRLRLANRVWAQDGMPIEKSFLDTLKVNYGAPVALSDFRTNAEKARVEINDWVSWQTETRINPLLNPGDVDGDTRMVLVNAIYFNAAWEHQFKVEQTKPGTFAGVSGPSQASFMSLTEQYGYTETADYQAVELRYGGRDTSMVIVLPKPERWATVESGIDGALYQTVTQNLNEQDVSVTIPKFEIKGDTVSLSEVLQALGMKAAFSGAADFSGMVKPAIEQIYIGDVLHKAFVNVDENGTEAAAATAVVMKAGSAPVEPPVSVTANRPFFFFVRDVPTNSVLFMGRVAHL